MNRRYLLILTAAAALGLLALKGPSREAQSLVASLSGRILFQSNRDGALSEVWLLEQGRLRKLASGAKRFSDLPADFPAVAYATLADLKFPQWGPDGVRILCTGRGKMILLNGETGETIEEIQPERYVDLSLWAPGGEAFYYVAEDRQPQGATDNLYRYDPAERTSRQLTHLPVAQKIRKIRALCISPDDREMIFSLTSEAELGYSLWRVNTDGSNLRLFAKNGSEQFVQIGVRDSGIGIAEKDLDNIFTPFFTTKKGGNGLGLAISHQIVQEHGGYVAVESQLGKGTTFCVNLPVDYQGMKARPKVHEEDLGR